MKLLSKDTNSGKHWVTECGWTGEQKLQYTDIPEDIEPDEIRPMGNYAVSIVWSDGFNQVSLPSRGDRGRNLKILIAGLTCAMFMKDGFEVIYGEEEIAYQIGETTETVKVIFVQLLTVSGHLSCSLFIYTSLLCEQASENYTLLIGSNRALTFGEYLELLFDKYYHTRT
ncbi:hypothetical protein SAY87_029192 [Trapa incisa]|uniref:Gamma-butyrobetaine hydroxylase-like N-terminal domain-containing protein n=1 Tax=Trapa incisa TaxID=236973 RepID=A0AAN7L139_9MYRT|nr:hypothetical protein SAY87_029192 [Trapa incisa]